MSVDPWSPARLEATVNRFLGVGSDFDLPLSVRFVRAVVALVRRRLASEGGERGFAYFLLYPPAATGPVDRQASRVTMLDLGQDRVTGRLWYVNCVANDGHAFEIAEGESHSRIAEVITDELSLGNIPTLVLDATTALPSGRFFPNGLNDLETVTTVVFSSEDVSWDRIRETVDGVHRTNLVTPELQNKADSLWADAEHYWAASDAEYKVQSAIKAGLAGAFPYCDIRSEQPQAEGRHDLLIEEYAEVPGGTRAVVPHAMIELKVLRSRGSTGVSVSDNATRDWAVSGVKQAHSYGTGRHSHLTLLFLFDARNPPAGVACLEPAYDLAAEHLTTIGRWRLYGRSGDYRDDLLAVVAGE